MSETFHPLRVSSKFAICGLPLTVDSYRTCAFGCKYCFANYRKIMGQSGFKVADLKWLASKLKKVYDNKIISPGDFLENLLDDRITWHYGGLSDPFQPIEASEGITAKMLELTNEYRIAILFSTKTDRIYDAPVTPELHSFQLSITGTGDRTDIEPGVPPFESRLKFYRFLKDAGFKVGIRMQPFIPKVTTRAVVDVFHDADYFSIEGLKLTPQDKEHRGFLLNLIGLQVSDFEQMGLMNMKPHIRLRLYAPVLDALHEYGLPYSIADNDLHHMTSSKCCCGEPLVKKSTGFNNTALFHKTGGYRTDGALAELGRYSQCRANHLFASNRQEGLKTVEEFIRARSERPSSPVSTKFQYGYHEKDQTTLDTVAVGR